MAHHNKTPRPGPDTEAHPGERRPADEVTGSQTGTIGGGGSEAHNPSPVRATGSKASNEEMVGAEPEESEHELDEEEFDDDYEGDEYSDEDESK